MILNLRAAICDKVSKQLPFTCKVLESYDLSIFWIWDFSFDPVLVFPWENWAFIWIIDQNWFVWKADGIWVDNLSQSRKIRKVPIRHVRIPKFFSIIEEVFSKIFIHYCKKGHTNVMLQPTRNKWEQKVSSSESTIMIPWEKEP